jgi:excisionase family DNA binding protein
MRTLSLAEAAAVLRMHPEEVRRRAKCGAIPAAKPGRCWIFIEDDLAEYVRSLYATPRQALQVTLRKETECHFANAAVSGGSTSLLQTGSEYADLLGLPSKPRRRSFTTG